MTAVLLQDLTQVAACGCIILLVVIPCRFYHLCEHFDELGYSRDPGISRQLERFFGPICMGDRHLRNRPIRSSCAS